MVERQKSLLKTGEKRVIVRVEVTTSDQSYGETLTFQFVDDQRLYLP